MKLKCNDGKVRDFEVAHGDGDFLPDGSRHDGFAEAYCKHCNEGFGCHDTHILKPKFREHVCHED